MTGDRTAAGALELAAVRRRWRVLARGVDGAALRVALLSTYTIDPLVPHLGTALHDVGLPAHLSVGPYHQIAQQCLDDAGETAGTRPDVLVVAPRFEDLADHGDLLDIADAAWDATRRWRCALLFVLPAIGPARLGGAGDAGRPDGEAARAVSTREVLRLRLAGLPNVIVADADEAIRTVGAAQAYRPGMYRFARIPYGEEVFAVLGGQLAALLAARYRGACRLLVLDLDSLAGEDPAVALPALRVPLEALRRAGTRLAVRASLAESDAWQLLAAHLPVVTYRLDGWAVDARPPAAQLAGLAAATGVPLGQVALLTTTATAADAATATGAAADADAATVDDGSTWVRVPLGTDPDSWPAELAASGVGTVLPAAVLPDPRPAAGVLPDGGSHRWSEPARVGGAAQPAQSPAQARRAYIDGLRVQVVCRDVPEVAGSTLPDLVARAHDFTLGTLPVWPEPADPATLVFAARVSDRLGDYGTAAAVSMRCADAVCTVEVFSVSCPALGRGVEDVVLAEIVARARDRGCTDIVLPYRDTGRNRVTVDFLRGLADQHLDMPAGQHMPAGQRLDGPAGRPLLLRPVALAGPALSGGGR